MDNRWVCLVLALAGLSLVKTEEECKISSDYCSCTTKDKLTIDLNHIGLTYPATSTDSEGKYEFIYMPCKPTVCEGSGSDNPSVACQDILSQKTSVSLGRTSSMNWTIMDSSSNSLKFQITYGNGDGDRGTRVTFTKTNASSTTFQYKSENTGTLVYFFQVNGKAVAPHSKSGGGSGGTIAGPIGLVIIFLALGALIAYFVIGGIYMYAQKGARGLEVIPNYTFWKDLPFLIKDGFLFVISPCYKRGATYQSL